MTTINAELILKKLPNLVTGNLATIKKLDRATQSK